MTANAPLAVAEARARMVAHLARLPVETVPLEAALGRVLAEPVLAPAHVPPFANASMDGYVVRLEDVPSVPCTLPVTGEVPAGVPVPPPLPPGQAWRITTGAPVPPNAGAVVPVEDTDDPRRAPGQRPAQVTLLRQPRPQANIRPVGQDLRAGESALPAGHALTPAALGVLAALGLAQVRVHQQPRVALLSTGDELVPAGAGPLASGQIYDANSHSLAAALTQAGVQVVRLGQAPDRAEAVRAKLLEAVAHGVHAIITSAGVSVGAYDVVKQVVEEEGALTLWRINMRPGKPLAFGHVRGIPFFGLPGNPVSALVTFEVLVRPALLHLGGHTRLLRPTLMVQVAEGFRSDGRESYLRAVVDWHAQPPLAHFTGDQSSNVLTSLVKANALLVVPAGQTEVPAQASLPAWWLAA